MLARDGVRDGVRDAPWHATLSFSFMLKLGALLDFIGLYWNLAAETQKDTRKKTRAVSARVFSCV